MDIATRSSLLITTALLLLVVMASVVTFAEMRHSRELSDIARSEAEKRYIIEWWLNSTIISNTYNISKIEDITPDKASNILSEHIYRNDMGLFIGGVQFRFLKYLSTGVEYITVDDVIKIFEAVLNTKNMTLSCENILGKMFFHITISPRRGPDACKYTANDVDQAVSLILEIAIGNSISSEYLSSIIAKFYILRIAINSGIYRETYEKILDELLMKESMLLAFMFKSMTNDLGIKIIEEISIGDVLRSIDRGNKNVISNIDLDLLFKTLIELSREIQGKKLDINVLSMVIEIVFKEGLDLSDIEKLVSIIREVRDESSLITTISSVFKQETTANVEMVTHNNTVIGEGYMGSSTSMVDYRRIYEERYGEIPIDLGEGLLDTIDNRGANNNTGSPGNELGSEVILESEFQRLLERANKESLNLNIIRVDKDSSISEKGLYAQSPRVLTGRIAEIYRYIPIALGLLIMVSYVLVYARGDLARFTKYLIRFFKRTLSLTNSQQKSVIPVAETFEKRALFLRKFWEIIVKLSSRYGVEISASTTHREAYRLLVTRDMDTETSRMLWRLVLSYEIIRYNRVFEDIDIDSLINIADSL